MHKSIRKKGDNIEFELQNNVSVAIEKLDQIERRLINTSANAHTNVRIQKSTIGSIMIKQELYSLKRNIKYKREDLTKCQKELYVSESLCQKV